MYLFFDTETNGLPKDWKAKMSDVDNWGRIIQLGWQLYDSERQLIMECKDLIVPNGWTIPVKEDFLNKGMTEAKAIENAKFWVDNGFSTELNKLSGIPIHKALERFLFHYDMAFYMIAHNMNFDYNVVGAEMIRLKMKAGQRRLERICTMEKSTNFLKLPGGYRGSYKFPKLEELHRFLFKEEFDGAHDALADVKATARCFFELIDRGIIVLPKIKI